MITILSIAAGIDNVCHSRRKCPVQHGVPDERRPGGSRVAERASRAPHRPECRLERTVGAGTGVRGGRSGASPPFRSGEPGYPRAMTRFGYTLMTEQSGPKDLVRYAVSAERHRFRLRSVQRPLLPVAVGAGTCAVRLVGARCGRPRHRAGGADDLRDLPDHALPPGGRRAEGRDGADAGRRPVHAGPRQRGEPQRARRRRRAGRRSRGVRTCCARPSRSSASY